jgi:hypothetical protein
LADGRSAAFGEDRMSFGRVDAGNGLNWLTEAIGIVFRNPGAFLVMALIVGVINLIPFLGSLAIVVCGPALLGGIVHAARTEAEGGKAELGQLFQAFQEPGKIGPMLLLCLPAIVGAALLLVFGLVFGIGALIGGGLSAANGSGLGAGAIGGGLLVLCLIGLVVVLAIYALQFFAIPRVMLDAVEPFAAMKESLAACLRNIGAFLVFGVVFTVICIVAAMVLVLIPIIGWIVMSGVATVILGAALFIAWRQVYAAGASATGAMPPPAPEAPPPQS